MTLSTRTMHRATGMVPAGVVHCDCAPLEPGWFEARREGITGTDLPKILGLSDYGNSVSVWMDKRGEWGTDEAGEAALWGNVLEEPVAREWGRRHGANTVTIEMVRNRRAPWQIANLDRMVRDCPDGDAGRLWGCGLEVKTRSAWSGGQWGDDMPDDVLAQVAWERIVTGYPHVHVACLLGGQRLESHRYDPDPDLERLLIDEATTVWQAVESEERPHAEPNALLVRVLDRLYPGRVGIRELDTLEVVGPMVERYETARLDEKAAKGAKDRARAELVQELGENEIAVVDGSTPVYSFKANKAGTRSLAIDKAFRQENPDE